jgi:hypothetical protein
MDLQIISNLRTSVRNALKEAYPTTDIYTAELTSLVQEDDSNVVEFFTVFFSEGGETEDDEHLDDELYKTDTYLTVGYFHEKAERDQGWLDSEAGTIREAVMALDDVFVGDIKRDGWQYLPSADGSVPGIQFKFAVNYSN